MHSRQYPNTDTFFCVTFQPDPEHWVDLWIPGMALQLQTRDFACWFTLSRFKKSMLDFSLNSPFRKNGLAYFFKMFVGQSTAAWKSEVFSILQEERTSSRLNFLTIWYFSDTLPTLRTNWWTSRRMSEKMALYQAVVLKAESSNCFFQCKIPVSHYLLNSTFAHSVDQNLNSKLGNLCSNAA